MCVRVFKICDIYSNFTWSMIGQSLVQWWDNMSNVGLPLEWFFALCATDLHAELICGILVPVMILCKIMMIIYCASCYYIYNSRICVNLFKRLSFHMLYSRWQSDAHSHLITQFYYIVTLKLKGAKLPLYNVAVQHLLNSKGTILSSYCDILLVFY